MQSSLQVAKNNAPVKFTPPSQDSYIVQCYVESSLSMNKKRDRLNRARAKLNKSKRRSTVQYAGSRKQSLAPPPANVDTRRQSAIVPVGSDGTAFDGEELARSVLADHPNSSSVTFPAEEDNDENGLAATTTEADEYTAFLEDLPRARLIRLEAHHTGDDLLRKLEAAGHVEPGIPEESGGQLQVEIRACLGNGVPQWSLPPLEMSGLPLRSQQRAGFTFPFMAAVYLVEKIEEEHMKEGELETSVRAGAAIHRGSITGGGDTAAGVALAGGMLSRRGSYEVPKNLADTPASAHIEKTASLLQKRSLLLDDFKQPPAEFKSSKELEEEEREKRHRDSIGEFNTVNAFNASGENGEDDDKKELTGTAATAEGDHTTNNSTLVVTAGAEEQTPHESKRHSLNNTTVTVDGIVVETLENTQTQSAEHKSTADAEAEEPLSMADLSGGGDGGGGKAPDTPIALHEDFPTTQSTPHQLEHSNSHNTGSVGDLAVEVMSTDATSTGMLTPGAQLRKERRAQREAEKKRIQALEEKRAANIAKREADRASKGESTKSWALEREDSRFQAREVERLAETERRVRIKERTAAYHEGKVAQQMKFKERQEQVRVEMESFMEDQRSMIVEEKLRLNASNQQPAGVSKLMMSTSGPNSRPGSAEGRVAQDSMGLIASHSAALGARLRPLSSSTKNTDDQQQPKHHDRLSPVTSQRNISPTQQLSIALSTSQSISAEQQHTVGLKNNNFSSTGLESATLRSVLNDLDASTMREAEAHQERLTSDRDAVKEKIAQDYHTHLMKKAIERRVALKMDRRRTEAEKTIEKVRIERVKDEDKAKALREKQDREALAMREFNQKQHAIQQRADAIVAEELKLQHYIDRRVEAKRAAAANQ